MTEAATRSVLLEKVFLEILKDIRNLRNIKVHRKTPVPESPFLIKLQASVCNFIKKEAVV